MDRKEWKQRINKRLEDLEKWERQQANFFNGNERVETMNFELHTANLQCDECGELCKSIGGLKTHTKNTLRQRIF